MPEELIANRTVLAVFPSGEDRTLLATILGRSPWKMRFTTTVPEARNALHGFSFGVVVTDGRLPGGYSWRDILRELQEIAASPPLIVVDRLADESLWAEVLNLGGYDLLRKPLDTEQVRHAVATACSFCENERRMRSLRKSPIRTRQSISENAVRAAVAGSCK